MKTENTFYVFKEISVPLRSGFDFNIETGQMTEGSAGSAVLKRSIDSGIKKIRAYYNDSNATSIMCLQWDKNDNYLGYDEFIDNANVYADFNVFSNTRYVAIYFVEFSANKYINMQTGFKVNPHYKQLKKKLKKESNQMFFRETLDGKLNLFGTDYLIVKNASIEENLYFYVYKNEALYASASFNKSDCKFDHFKKNVELKLNYNDGYSKILDAYENTYDLIKLAPALTKLTLTKRTVLQIYFQGENTISNYAGGTYWETEVDEQVDDENNLRDKYHFAKGPKYKEISLSNFNYERLNDTYRIVPSSNTWNATSKNSYITFTKVANAGQIISVPETDVKLLSSGDGSGVSHVGGPGGGAVIYTYDTYRIEIYGNGVKIYQSDYLYGKDGSDFSISAGTGLYPMTSMSLNPSPSPSTFHIGHRIIEYQLWGRILCDADTFIDTEGQIQNTFDLPRDDFATPRRNYRKCFGVIGFDREDAVVKIFQNTRTSDEPTSYGMNDYGKYFIPPLSYSGQYYYPLERSSWANMSLWIRLGDSTGDVSPFERYCRKFYKEYSIKDTYHICDVIKALLKKIDPSIKHEKTSTYSSFLYGHSGGTASALGGCNIYITQKTNILKGEYDQAAQKAEIKFKQLMDMLRDCFRCYWFVDEQNRFRIEHISYFMNGQSYNQPSIQIDLTKKNDKFNKKETLYCQQEIEFDKADLTSRYEFKYADGVTKAMGGDLYVDVKDAYIQKDKTEEINIDGFTADIDYMLFLPDDFSNDGFALLLADSNRKVPIVKKSITDEKHFGDSMQVYVQNWYASFNQLIWHYMEDISGWQLESNNIDQESLYAHRVKRCMKHNIEFPSNQFKIDAYKLIATDAGNGYIEEITTNIDTDMTEVELRYEPR